MKLQWSNLAQSELQKLRAYSIEKWGKTVAIAYLSDIRDAANRVAHRPNLSRPLRDGWRIMRVRSHYLILKADVEADTLTIARVLHVAMDIERHLPREE
jgi:plasmid stabilization system protein ParE